MHSDEYLEKLLSGYGTKPEDCFLVFDARSQTSSVFYRDGSGRLRMLFVDDKELDNRLTEFIRSRGVRTFNSVNELEM